MMTKYKIGDWCYDNDHDCSDCFWKIHGIFRSDIDGLIYHVKFMRDTHESLEFRHLGDFCGPEERKLRPVTDANDLLRCRLSDAQTAYRKAQEEVDRCKADVDALLRSQNLLKGNDRGK